MPTVVTVEVLSGAVNEGDSGIFRITRSDTAGAATVSFDVGGTATEGDDYGSMPRVATFGTGETDVIVEVELGTTDDAISEPTETVVLTLAGGTDYTVGTPGTTTLNILDNDAQVVTIAATSNGVEGGMNGKFRFARTGDLTASLTVNYTVSGTAGSGDFTALSGTVTFAAGSNTADVDVAVTPDTIYDPNETVIVTVASGTGYSVGTEDTDTVVIVDSASLGFTLGSNVGTANYTIPWSSVDDAGDPIALAVRLQPDAGRADVHAIDREFHHVTHRAVRVRGVQGHHVRHRHVGRSRLCLRFGVNERQRKPDRHGHRPPDLAPGDGERARQARGGSYKRRAWNRKRVGGR